MYRFDRQSIWATERDINMTAGPARSRDVDPRDSYYHYNLRKAEAVVEYTLAERSVKTNVHLIKRAAEAGELEYAIISGARCFSRAGVDAWLLSMVKPVGANDRKVSA